MQPSTRDSQTLEVMDERLSNHMSTLSLARLYIPTARHHWWPRVISNASQKPGHYAIDHGA